jgi:hypothetical protein
MERWDDEGTAIVETSFKNRDLSERAKTPKPKTTIK